MKRAFFVCFMFYTLTTYGQLLVIDAILLEEITLETIPYASIIDLTSKKHGTTSHINGYFKLSLPPESTNHALLFSSLGYKDTVINVSDLLDVKEVYLTPKVYRLPDITILSKRNEESEIGKAGASPHVRNGQKIGFEALPGFSWGAYVQVKNKDRGLLKSINVYIADGGFPEAPLAVRILSYEGKPEFGKNQQLDLFQELTRVVLIIRAAGSGWFELDVSEFEIPIPKTGIYCLFTPLDEGPQFVYETPFGQNYGSIIGLYGNTKDGKDIFPIVIDGSTLTVFKNNQVPSPAISVVYEKVK